MTEPLITSNRPLGAKLSICWWRDVEVTEQVPWRAVWDFERMCVCAIAMSFTVFIHCGCMFTRALICVAKNLHTNVCVYVYLSTHVSSGVFLPSRVEHSRCVQLSPEEASSALSLSLLSLSSSPFIRTYPPMFIRHCSSDNKLTSLLIPFLPLVISSLLPSISLYPSKHVTTWDFFKLNLSKLKAFSGLRWSKCCFKIGLLDLGGLKTWYICYVFASVLPLQQIKTYIT